MSVAPTDQYNPEKKSASIHERTENLPKKFKYMEPKAATGKLYNYTKWFHLVLIISVIRCKYNDKKGNW